MDYHVHGFSLNVLKLCLVMIHFSKHGDSADYSIDKGFRNGTNFECGKGVTIQCQFQTILPRFNWYIGKNALTETDIAARCIDTSTTCQKNSNLPSSYSFTFDSPGKRSHLTISPVTSAENRLQFFCNDGATNKFFEASVVVIPETSLIVNETRPLSNGTEFRVTTNCIYPANLTMISWYSSLSNGLDYTEHLQAERILTECESTPNDCKIANASKKVRSVLMLSLPDIHSPRIVGVKIIFDNIYLFSMPVGEYMHPDTTSTSIPTSSTNTTTMSTPLRTNTSTTTITTTTSTTTTSTTTAAITAYTNTTANTTTTVPPTSKRPVISSTTSSGTTDSIRQFFQKYKFEAIAVGGSLTVVIIVAIVICMFCKRKGHRDSSQTELTNINRYDQTFSGIR